MKPPFISNIPILREPFPMLEQDDLEGLFHPRPFCDFFLQSNQLFFFFSVPILLLHLSLQYFTAYSLLIWLIFQRSSSMFSVCKQLSATIIKEAIQKKKKRLVWKDIAIISAHLEVIYFFNFPAT